MPLRVLKRAVFILEYDFGLCSDIYCQRHSDRVMKWRLNPELQPLAKLILFHKLILSGLCQKHVVSSICLIIFNLCFRMHLGDAAPPWGRYNLLGWWDTVEDWTHSLLQFQRADGNKALWKLQLCPKLQSASIPVRRSLHTVLIKNKIWR